MNSLPWEISIPTCLRFKGGSDRVALGCVVTLSSIYQLLIFMYFFTYYYYLPLFWTREYTEDSLIHSEEKLITDQNAIMNISHY